MTAPKKGPQELVDVEESAYESGLESGQFAPVYEGGSKKARNMSENSNTLGHPQREGVIEGNVKTHA